MQSIAPYHIVYCNWSDTENWNFTSILSRPLKMAISKYSNVHNTSVINKRRGTGLFTCLSKLPTRSYCLFIFFGQPFYQCNLFRPTTSTKLSIYYNRQGNKQKRVSKKYNNIFINTTIILRQVFKISSIGTAVEQ